MKLPAPLKSCLLSLYYNGTLPYRRWRNERLYAAGRAPLLTLFYHRVSQDRCVPWNHSYEEFQNQIDWLQAHFEFIDLAETQRRIRSGVNDRPAVAITFDDGYAENCDFALPLLIDRGIPCTYYVNTYYVREQLPFPHDIARGRRLLPNTVEQLRILAECGIEIAAHTRTHADMGKIHDPRLIREEISVCGDELEQMIGKPVRHFAFPYGMPHNMTEAAFRIAREHGYETVASAYGDYNYVGDDGFHIRRVHPDDLGVLKNWATFDPRKMRRCAPCVLAVPRSDRAGCGAAARASEGASSAETSRSESGLSFVEIDRT
ncbi:MAG: polysaccharide deacetylase family protein [Pirellulales bacterium]